MDAITYFKESVRIILPRWLVWMVGVWISVEVIKTVSEVLLWILTKLRG
jgi:hypothetical protein